MFGFHACSPRKKSVLTFSNCLKRVFQPVFSSFNNAFWFHLMTSKWDQERVRLSVYPLWTSSGCGRVEYLNHDEWKFWQIHRPKRNSKTRIIRQCSFIQTLYLSHFTNDVPCYIQNNKIECGTCKLYPFQLNIPMQINWTPLYIYVLVIIKFSANCM